MTVEAVDKKLTELRQQLQQAIQQAAGKDATCIRLDQAIRDWQEIRTELNGKAEVVQEL